MKDSYINLGGDINQSISEGYRFDFKNLLKESFQITTKTYLHFIYACTLTIIFLFFSFSMINDLVVDQNDNIKMLANLGFSVFIAPPFMAGLQMMGIFHSVGIRTKTNNLFNCFRYIFKLSLAAMIISLLVNLVSVISTKLLGDSGFKVTLIFLLYLNIVFCLVYPLIIEKKTSVPVALKLSLFLVNKNLFQFTKLFLLLGVFFIIGLLPYGLGMFFFIPFYFNLMGVIYREACGISVIATKNTNMGFDA